MAGQREKGVGIKGEEAVQQGFDTVVELRVRFPKVSNPQRILFSEVRLEGES
jgi:hypothetical protein